jgi:hypothetical protein
MRIATEVGYVQMDGVSVMQLTVEDYVNNVSSLFDFIWIAHECGIGGGLLTLGGIYIGITPLSLFTPRERHSSVYDAANDVCWHPPWMEK